MPGRFELYEDRAGKYRFRLKASNGQLILHGFSRYERKAAAKKATESVKVAAKDAVIVDLTTD